MTLKSFIQDQLSPKETEQLCQRPKLDFEALFSTVRPIINNVRDEGDSAVRTYSEKFDGASPDPICISPAECNSSVSDEVKGAIDIAIRNVLRFHREQAGSVLEVETMPGIVCSKVDRPVERVGLYIPGGTAPLPSTAIMLSVPAVAAGCKTIVLATPPDRDGNIPPTIAYIAQKVGITHIVRAGGAQAVAAMAWGTETVPKVDKLFGPGNQYVTAAKMMLQNSEAMVSIDLPAGPSEVLVIADGNADPEFVAIDLLSQAEHGPDSQVVLVAIDGFNTTQLETELSDLMDRLPRASIAEKALANSFIVQSDTVESAIRFSNQYAPEHLILNVKDASDYTELIRNAGSVFLGSWTPESLGDYASGTNHTLPTYGYARMYGGVSLKSFQKSMTFQQATPDGLRTLGPAVETLARVEGLGAHELAVTLRLNKLKAGEGDE